MKKLENKTVFITGGLSGIGKACAIAAAKEGGNIVIADMNSADNKSTMAEITSINTKAIFIECDVSVFTHLQVAIQKTVDTFGTLDVALNDAGIGGEANKIGEMTEHAWLKVINVNLNGVFNSMHHELLQMSKQKNGIIVNIASILAKVYRDRQLLDLDKLYPQYGFAQHKGYPTKMHIAALQKYGPITEHRRSFGPVFNLLQLQVPA